MLVRYPNARRNPLDSADCCSSEALACFVSSRLGASDVDAVRLTRIGMLEVLLARLRLSILRDPAGPTVRLAVR